MDSFETVVSEILWRKGYWTQTAFKVELSDAEKQAINRPTSPRWEIDVLAYSGAKKELLVVECKSYLDSGGVSLSAFDGRNPKFAGRFKLFNEPVTRNVVLQALVKQLSVLQACPPDVSTKLCLVAGKIAGDRDGQLRKVFDENGWILWDSSWLKSELQSMSRAGYSNQVSAVVAKLLLRGVAN